MHSLSDLKEFLDKLEIQIKEFGGWYIKIGKDTWTMKHGVYFKNNEPQNLKQKNLFDNYKKVKKNDNTSNKTRVWRGISSRNYK